MQDMLLCSRLYWQLFLQKIVCHVLVCKSLVEFLEFLSILLILLYERLRSNWLGFVCLGGVTRSDFDLNATFYLYFLQLALLKKFYDLCIWDSLKMFCKHVCNYQIFTICLGQSGWMNNQLIFSFQLNIHTLCQFYDYLSTVVKCVKPFFMRFQLLPWWEW